MGHRCLVREPGTLKPCPPLLPPHSTSAPSPAVVRGPAGACGVQPSLAARKRSTNNPGSRLSPHYSKGPLVVQWTLGSPERYLMFTKRHFDGTPGPLMLRDIISSAEPPAARTLLGDLKAGLHLPLLF